MRASSLDFLYRKLLLTKFFTKGWGSPDGMQKIFDFRKALSDRNLANSFVDPNTEVILDKEETSANGFRFIQGHFLSPGHCHLFELLPPEASNAHFELILPMKDTNPHKPVCVQFAGTGDHFYWRRRRLMALPLAQEQGIASILIENPFYGLRKPKQQLRSSLRYVTDLFVMGMCLILESLFMYHWCKRQGFGPVVFHGISMGGHMATLSATVIPKPIAVVPCLAWSTAALTFTRGVLAGAIPWHMLQRQLQESKDELSQFASNMLLDCSPRMQVQGSEVSLFKVVQSKNEEALYFMDNIMNECTHLRNFSMPIDPTMCISVQAERDAYQPSWENYESIADTWPGTEIRTIPEHGHVSSYLFKHGIFKNAIYNSLDNLVRKYGIENV